MLKSLSLVVVLLVAALVGTGCNYLNPSPQEIAAFNALSEEDKGRVLDWIHAENLERWHVAAANARSKDCFEAMEKHFTGDKAMFRQVIWRESRNIPTAANPSSTARGCAQLMMSLHSHRFYAVGCSPADWADPDCNLKAADHLYREAGMSPWRLTAY